MIKPRVKVDLYRNITDNTWSTTPVEVTDRIELNEEEGIETRKDSFNFKIPNHLISGIWNNRNGLSSRDSNAFRINDQVKIYAWYGNNNLTGSDLNDALIMDGIIGEFNQDIDDNGKMFVGIRGNNRTETILNSMVPATYSIDDPTNTVPEILKALLKRVNQPVNKKMKISYALTSETNPVTLGSGYIAATKVDGTAFPEISYFSNYKSFYKILEEISKYDNTGDVVPYIFYIKYSKNDTTGEVFNELVWKPKTTTPVGSLTEGVDFSTSKVTKGVWDVINAMIVNAGIGLFGNGILDVVTNNSSMGKVGAKWKYYPQVNTFADLHVKEKNRGIATFDNDGFPGYGGSEYTFVFQDRDIYGLANGVTSTAGSDEEFNDKLRLEARWQIKLKAQPIVDALGDPRFKVSLEQTVGSNSLGNGGLYNLKIPSFGWEGTDTNPTKKMRLVSSNHKFNLAGWTTTNDFEEDEKSIQSQFTE